jgi:hypothetical protein
MPDRPNATDSFLADAGGRRPGLLRELFEFVLHNKKWWLIPILVSILLLGFLVALSGSGLAPFIYTVF